MPAMTKMPTRNLLKTRFSARLFLALVLLLAFVAATAGTAQAGENGVRPALKRVETKRVCMVNNQVFDKDQIPVAVEGKTYYGCCEMCKERLAKDVTARTGTDPVSGKPVDKATAVIGALPDGKVLYFESEATFGEATFGEYSKKGE